MKENETIENALRLLIGRCKNPSNHDIGSLEEFARLGGNCCPICLTEAFRELALSTLAVCIEVEHGLKPNIEPLQRCLNAFILKERQ